MAKPKYKGVKEIISTKKTKKKPLSSVKKRRGIAKRSKAKAKGQRGRSRARFSDMGLYFFNYNEPKYYHQLHIFDKRPLVYPLDIGKDSMLGINLHWLNPMWRFKFINMLHDASSKIKNQRKFVRWVYIMFKTDPKLRFAYPAIRRYLNNRIKHSQRIDRAEVGEANFLALMSSKYPAKMIKGGLN